MVNFSLGLDIINAFNYYQDFEHLFLEEEDPLRVIEGKGFKKYNLFISPNIQLDIKVTEKLNLFFSPIFSSRVVIEKLFNQKTRFIRYGIDMGLYFDF